MISVLNKGFLNSLNTILDYQIISEADHFIENPSNDHIYIKLLEVRAYLGYNKIDAFIAEELVKLDYLPFIVLCSDLDQPSDLGDESLYTEVTSDDLDENGEFPDDWENFIILLTE